MKKILVLLLIGVGAYYYYHKHFMKLPADQMPKTVAAPVPASAPEEPKSLGGRVLQRDIAQVKVPNAEIRDNKILVMDGDVMILRAKPNNQGQEFIKGSVGQELKNEDKVKVGEYSYLIFALKNSIMVKVMSRSSFVVSENGFRFDEGKIFFSLESPLEQPFKIVGKRSELIFKESSALYWSIDPKEDEVAVLKGWVGVSPDYIVKEKEGMVLGDSKVLLAPGKHEFVENLAWGNLAAGLVKREIKKEVKKEDSTEVKIDLKLNPTELIEKATGIDEAKKGMKEHYDKVKEIDVEE